MVEEITYNELYDRWLSNRGVGSAILNASLNPFKIISDILERMYLKNAALKAFVVTDNMNHRQAVVDYLSETSKYNGNNKIKLGCGAYTIFSEKFAEDRNYTPLESWDIFISINVLPTDRIASVMNEKCKFRLCLFTDAITDNKVMLSLKQTVPIIYKADVVDIKTSSLASPVKDVRHLVSLPDTEFKEYEQASKFIADTTNIFGSFDNMERARVGDKYTNESAEQILVKIAYENGWSHTLDMDNHLNRDLDAYYNPVALRERLNNYYTIVRARASVVANASCKLDEVLAIVEEHKDKKILILSKSSMFADQITDLINARMSATPKPMISSANGVEINVDVLKGLKCASYHADCPPIPAIDALGQVVRYKTGEKKGQVRMMATTAQNARKLMMFNSGKLSVLSATNSIDKSFVSVIDVLIITSTYCLTVRELKDRVDGLGFSSKPNLVYRIACKNTVESAALEREIRTNGDEIVIKDEISGDNDSFCINSFVD